MRWPFWKKSPHLKNTTKHFCCVCLLQNLFSLPPFPFFVLFISKEALYLFKFPDVFNHLLRWIELFEQRKQYIKSKKEIKKRNQEKKKKRERWKEKKGTETGKKKKKSLLNAGKGYEETIIKAIDIYIYHISDVIYTRVTFGTLNP
jgi:hypothetical protein